MLDKSFNRSLSPGEEFFRQLDYSFIAIATLLEAPWHVAVFICDPEIATTPSSLSADEEGRRTLGQIGGGDASEY